MVNPRKEKLDIKDAIMDWLQREGQTLRSRLQASICLESGFSEKVVRGIVDDLIAVGWVSEELGFLKITDEGREWENEKGVLK